MLLPEFSVGRSYTSDERLLWPETISRFCLRVEILPLIKIIVASDWEVSFRFLTTSVLGIYEDVVYHNCFLAFGTGWLTQICDLFVNGEGIIVRDRDPCLGIGVRERSYWGILRGKEMLRRDRKYFCASYRKLEEESVTKFNRPMQKSGVLRSKNERAVAVSQQNSTSPTFCLPNARLLRIHEWLFMSEKYQK